MQVSQLQATITRPADTTAYTAGDTVGGQIQFQPTGGGFNLGGQIKAGACVSSQNAATKPDLELWLFAAALAAAPTDNAAFAPTDADMLTLIGVIPFATGNFKVANAGSAGAGNSACVITSFDLPVPQYVYGVMVVRNAYAPISAEVISVNLSVLRSYAD